MEEADPPGLLYRIGRAPDPLAWPPPNPDGRYSDPQGTFRVLYAASERRTAFLETLQGYRPALRDLAILAQAFRSETVDLPFPIGVLPSAYFAKHIAAFRLDQAQRWLDLRLPRTHALLRNALAAELIAAGYAGAFNFGEIIGADYRITRTIARWAYDAGFGGIAYPSAHDSRSTCWAIFDRASLTPAGRPEPIQRDDPELLAVLELFGLALPDEEHGRSASASSKTGNASGKQTPGSRMIDTDDIDDVQAAQIDRRIGQAFAFARIAVDDPNIMDVFANGSDLGIKDIAPNPHIPEHAFIVEGTTATGESVSVAVGVCECNTNHDPTKGRFWLRAGEQWVCAECRRVYAFDGEWISVTEDADAIIGS